MSGQSASEVIFISVSHSTTLTGKVWLIVFLFLRVLVLLLAGYPLFQDEQERFVCNTIQPGCANVCYDLFAPVSLFRFWLAQLVALSLPYAVFVAYVVHRVSAGLAAAADGTVPGPERSLPVNAASLLRAEPGGERCFAGAYLLQLLFRAALEAGFGAAHYYLFGVFVPRRFLCQQQPCTSQADCYVSRPTEKTVMLWFMLAVGALSLLLGALDVVCAAKRSARRRGERRRRRMAEEEEPCYLPSGGGGREGDADEPARRDVVPAGASRPGSFRKRGAAKGSLPGSPVALSLGAHPGMNTNGNNGYGESQDDGSEVALCPPEPPATPRPVHVSKRGRLKPPPPPRRDLAPPPPLGDVSKATATVCNRRVGQYTLVELTGGGGEPQGDGDGQEKRSEWV